MTSDIRPSTGTSDPWPRRALAAAQQLHREIVGARLPVISAGVAFYGFFAMFPLLLAVLSLYGLVAEPDEVQRAVRNLSYAMPAEAQAMISEQLRDIADDATSELSLSFLVSVVVAVVSAAKAMFALIWGLNVAYGCTETRRYLVQRLLSIALTAGAVAFVTCSLILIAVLPLVLPLLGLARVQELLFTLGRWPVLALAYMFGLSVLYHHAPNRKPGRFSWFSPGASFAAALWLAASIAMSVFAEHLPDYNEIYGALGGVIALDAWIYVSILAILLGAKLNAMLERKRLFSTD